MERLWKNVTQVERNLAQKRANRARALQTMRTASLAPSGSVSNMYNQLRRHGEQHALHNKLYLSHQRNLRNSTKTFQNRKAGIAKMRAEVAKMNAVAKKARMLAQRIQHQELMNAAAYAQRRLNSRQGRRTS